MKIIDKYLICFVLIIVALVQLYNSQLGYLSPWKGGGFGMFATNKKTNITAVGYLHGGDSVLINVKSSKFDVPISYSMLRTTKTYPKKKNLLRLGKLIVNSYLKPKSLEIKQGETDERAFRIVNNQLDFYSTIYTPTHYENKKLAKADSAIEIEKVKIMIYETNFYNEELQYRKTYLRNLEISK